MCDEVIHSQKEKHEESEEPEEAESAQNEHIRKIVRAHQCAERQRWHEQEEKRMRMKCIKVEEYEEMTETQGQRRKEQPQPSMDPQNEETQKRERDSVRTARCTQEKRRGNARAAGGEPAHAQRGRETAEKVHGKRQRSEGSRQVQV